MAETGPGRSKAGRLLLIVLCALAAATLLAALVLTQVSFGP
jgi:hypothetical protein